MSTLVGRSTRAGQWRGHGVGKRLGGVLLAAALLFSGAGASAYALPDDAAGADDSGAGSARITVAVPLGSWVVVNRLDRAPFALRLDEIAGKLADGAHVGSGHPMATRGSRVWASVQWLNPDGAPPSSRFAKDEARGWRPASTLRSGEAALAWRAAEKDFPIYSFPLYLSDSPYSPNGIVYAVSVQPGLVMAMEKLNLQGSTPQATVTIAQERGMSPSVLPSFKIGRKFTHRLVIAPYPPAVVDVGSPAGEMVLAGSLFPNRSLGLMVQMKEEGCEAGLSPALFAGDSVVMSGVGTIKVTAVTAYPQKDPPLVGAAIGEAMLEMTPPSVQGVRCCVASDGARVALRQYSWF